MNNAARAGSPAIKRILLLASLMAVIAGAVYLAIGAGLVPDDFESPPRPVMLLAGVVYLGGAGVLHLVDRRLLLLGAIANGVVLVLFALSAVRGMATLDTVSLSGKAAQIALSMLLIVAWRRSAGGPDR